MSKTKKGVTKLRIALTATYFVCAIAVAIGLGVGDAYANTYRAVISNYFNQKTFEIVDDEDTDEDTEYFKTEFSTDDELYEASSAVAKQVEAEGITLLRNDNNTMPLGSNKKVSLFSVSSTDFVYGGTGSGQVNTSTALNLNQAFQSIGYEVNQTLWDFYSSSGYSRSLPSMRSSTVNYGINEVPVNDYTEEVINSFSEYNDAAIVVISRSGGEGNDLVADSSDGTTDGGDNNYLSLSTDEKDMMSLVDQHFSTTIVLLNVSNAIELDEISSYSSVKSIVWVGAPGQNGITAIAEIFDGTVNPSGKLPDTYVYDNFSSLSVMNRGSEYYLNGGDELNDSLDATSGGFGTGLGKFVVYQEGIYVGYRYYETRYEDVVLGTSNVGSYDYSSTVAYPFGYGLSYTEFTYSNLSVTDQDDDTYVLSVDVTNSGSVAGKEAVQVYLQKPYTSYDVQYGVEKASVELVAFGKTAELAAGATETVTIEVEKENFRTYDYTNAKTYIVEEGTYYLAVGNGSHDALNNILAKKGYSTTNGMDYNGTSSLAYELSVRETDKYSVSQTTGYEITNQLDSGDPNNYSGTGGVTYVTRSNWSGTIPTSRVELTLTDQIAEEVVPVEELDFSDSTTEMPDYGVDNGLTLAMLMGYDYDSEYWDYLVQQIELDDLYNLVADGAYHTNLVEKIASPYMNSKDGPQGISSTFTGTASGQPQAYPCEPILAATFNKELILRVGELVGEDGLHSDVQGWYAPGANIHRTPYAGRNFEYFSEDPYLSGTMNSLEVEGATSKGMVCYSKHFVFNDQETDRYGVNTWLNEQAAREIYLRSFEFATTKANGLAYMTSFNNHGTQWVGGSYALLTEIVRNEWGFEGHFITDYAIGTYMSLTEGIFAGNDLWLGSGALDSVRAPTALQSDWREQPDIIVALQKAAKNILYAVSKCNGMNGISTTSRIKPIMTTWQKWLIVLNVFVYSGLVVGGFFVGWSFWKAWKRSKDEEITE